MISSKPLAMSLVALGLVLTGLPATSWAAPVSFDRPANVSRSAVSAPLWSTDNSSDFGLLLLHLISSAADQLTFYQDAIAAEAYLGTTCDPPC